MTNFKTADLCDHHAEHVQVCKIDFHSYGKKARFFGKVETVKVHEDNVLFYKHWKMSLNIRLWWLMEKVPETAL